MLWLHVLICGLGVGEFAVVNFMKRQHWPQEHETYNIDGKTQRLRLENDVANVFWISTNMEQHRKS